MIQLYIYIHAHTHTSILFQLLFSYRSLQNIIILSEVSQTEEDKYRMISVVCGWASQVVLVVKNPPANAGDVRGMGSILGLGGSPGGGHGNSLQYSCLENPMDRGAWWATVHRVTVGHDWRDLACTSGYMWNLRKWYKWTYLQNRPMYIEN